nr:MAG TPA: Major capsid protein [Caudoviricetes sp.]
MSNMKRLVMKLMIALLVNVVVGGLIALAVGVAPWIGAVALNVIAIAVGACLPKDALRVGVFTEVWTGELVKSLRGGLEGSWLDGVPDQSTIVNNDVIHLVEVGVDPDVLINNTTYPIPSQALEDKDIAVKLDKFQTKVTPITDDELYAASYDKMARVKESHANALNDSKFTKAAHALCAQQDSAKTPILKTTGERDATTGRLRLTMADVVALKAAMDKLGVPAENRRLVLCPDHVNDLLLVSQTFREQYNIDRATGKVGKLYGFDVYEYANTPLYTQAGKKKNLGVAAGDGEFNCSFAFYTPRVFKATGSTKMYYSEAATDPEYQRNKINFRHYFLCMPKKGDAGVVMMSGYKAS